MGRGYNSSGFGRQKRERLQALRARNQNNAAEKLREAQDAFNPDSNEGQMLTALQMQHLNSKEYARRYQEQLRAANDILVKRTNDELTKYNDNKVDDHG